MRAGFALNLALLACRKFPLRTRNTGSPICVYGAAVKSSTAFFAFPLSFFILVLPCWTFSTAYDRSYGGRRVARTVGTYGANVTCYTCLQASAQSVLIHGTTDISLRTNFTTHAPFAGTLAVLHKSVCAFRFHHFRVVGLKVVCCASTARVASCASISVTTNVAQGTFFSSSMGSESP